jgi:hypothetical protein
MDGHYYLAGPYILQKLQKNQSVRCICPPRRMEYGPDFDILQVGEFSGRAGLP